MALLNITYQGVSGDTDIGDAQGLSDGDIKRIASEILRTGSIPNMTFDVDDQAFRDFVVERNRTPEGGERMFLRPKVPFGGASAEDVTEAVYASYPILKYFKSGHLPEKLKNISMSFEALAFEMALKHNLPGRPEAAAGLRKLLEAKDCFVRAALD